MRMRKARAATHTTVKARPGHICSACCHSTRASRSTPASSSIKPSPIVQGATTAPVRAGAHPAMAAAQPGRRTASGLSEDMLRTIRGEAPPEHKLDAYRDSLGRRVTAIAPASACTWKADMRRAAFTRLTCVPHAGGGRSTATGRMMRRSTWPTASCMTSGECSQACLHPDPHGTLHACTPDCVTACRCHLPRTTAGPNLDAFEPEVGTHQPQAQLQANGGHANGTGNGHA